MEVRLTFSGTEKIDKVSSNPVSMDLSVESQNSSEFSPNNKLEILLMTKKSKDENRFYFAGQPDWN